MTTTAAANDMGTLVNNLNNYAVSKTDIGNWAAVTAPTGDTGTGTAATNFATLKAGYTSVDLT